MAAFSFCFICSLLLLLEDLFQVVREDPFSFFADIDRRIHVPVHGIPTGRADVSPVRKLQRFKDMSAAAAGLRGREPAVHLHQAGTFPSELIGKHIPEHPEPVIVEVLSQGKGPAHPPKVQVFDYDNVVCFHQPGAFLLQEVLPLVFDLCMEFPDLL